MLSYEKISKRGEMLQENLKLFYLGLKQNSEPFLYKNKDLTTHATIIGMTGSGKTGLGITLLEEAAIDNIPSIIIDPKGDMTNLALTFPDMKASDFLPYIDENEAKSKGLSVEEMAKQTAKNWKNGIENSHQSLKRVKLLKNSAEFRIFTPKSSLGLGVSLLNNFEAPKILNEESLNEYTLSLSNSVLSLINENDSSKTLFLQNIFLENFKKGINLSITDLIHQIVTPPFSKLGAFDVETLYPANKRMEFAMRLNELIASPSFSQWCKGEKLDISKMLFNDNAKARCNIFTISHLNDDERMFFVTLLLNEIIRWMRTTDGTSSLRMILYMDEIFGFFPPTSNPPSKTPMLTLLKQARAYGVGCVLSTQNPVDLDYKGLSNIGTWFIGRLQTAQDKNRVISGLTGVDGSNKDELMEEISNLKKRTFLVKNINETNLEIISTRFALSYLKGPLSGEQISNLMADKKENFANSSSNFNSNLTHSKTKPIISPNIDEYFCYENTLDLKPHLLGHAKAIYKTKDFEYEKEINLALALEDDEISWQDTFEFNQNLSKTPKPNSEFQALPSSVASSKDLSKFTKDFKDYVYRDIKLTLFEALGEFSKPGEEKSDFLLRLNDKCNEILENETEKFQSKFNAQKEKLQSQIQKAQIKLDKEKSDVKSSGINAAINIGSAILGMFLGNKTLSKTNASKVLTSSKSASKVLNERKDVKIAQDALNILENNLNELIVEESQKLKELKEKYNLKNLEIKTTQIQAKKSDIFDEKVALLWKS